MFRYTFILRAVAITSVFIFVIIAVKYLVSDRFSANTESDCSSFDNYDNSSPLEHPVIPNIVHYILFEECEITFVHYLSIISVIKLQKPSQITIHTDCAALNGTYWRKLSDTGLVDGAIRLSQFERPTHVYGQRLSSIYHAGDVARIQILKRDGGIYLDCDTVVLNSLDPLRNYEMVVGWTKEENIGTQALLAHKCARLLQMWMEGYMRYVPSSWYYNAGGYPSQVLEKSPALAHRETELLGVHNLLDRLHTERVWDDWRRYYTLHLLSRHDPSPRHLDERVVRGLRTNFGRIARWILEAT